ncbi:uncharacterized protein LOC123684683 [Harmonia axyridis]|uniref:uncharacterized protein LOC123684683 n=1 Tax=Harmonia axyridis TaxID=115357 RepID=UPI001E27799A|nr:uncharacterized protein LOC123684683 [Harmonia axyridis]
MTSTTTIRKSYGNRKLYSLYPDDYPLKNSKLKISPTSQNSPKKSEDINKLIKYIEDNVVGKSSAFLGPFGRRKVVYCDYAAAGRSLQFIEEYILREVLPCYGNTHSTTSITSLQSTSFRQEARELIKNAVNANDEDAVIFTGHGCSDAIKKIIGALDLREQPVVFTGPSEHQDNILLWQEAGAEMIRIRETKEGFLDLQYLENQLKFHQNFNRLMIGCFSVASNVTGIITDDVACTILLHQYGALAFWDYNNAAPSISVDMNPVVPGVEEGTNANKDAIYFSGHKFIGGIQTPGILIAKKSLFRRMNRCEGDGFFVNEQNKTLELQEEGSCAAMVESIRAGLVIQLKEAVTSTVIMQRQEKINKQMLQHIRTIPELILLGNNSSNLKRLPLFSFMVRHPRGLYLHHNFVCAVLNDIFGIQARAGCPCSGPYAQELLGIDHSLADQYENIILEDRRLSSLNLGTDNSTLELLRPGFTRISLPYFINDNELAYIMEAVKMVATEGWKLLPQYMVDLETGEWRHYTNAITKDRKWLSSIRYVDGKMTMNERRISGPGLFPQNYSECLQTARNLFNRARKSANRKSLIEQEINFDSRCEKIRWFMLQQEAQDLLTSNAQNVKQNVPFDPSANFKQSPGREDQSQCSKVPTASNGSPRHYSFPSIEDPNLLTCSSPVPYFLRDVNGGLYYPQITQAPMNFAIGEAVNSANLNQLHQNFVRERCLSLGAPNMSSPVLSPSTRVSLGMGHFRTRNMSCGSQNDNSLESDANISPTHSLTVLSNGGYDVHSLGRASPAPDLQTYVTEMTKELATNIKSEIREVINKVEDVLENTDSLTSYNNERHGSGSEDGRSDSISAIEVAEYLEKVSIEMANEVKSEIRDVVSAVDVFIAPDSQHSYSRASSYGDDCSGNKHQFYTPGSSSDTVIQVMSKSCSSQTTAEDVQDADKYKMKVLPNSVTSVSSQDSGINLSFQEADPTNHAYTKERSSSESLGHRKTDKCEIKFSTLQKQRPFRESQEDPDCGKPNNGLKCHSKNIWEPSLEALQEFKMIKDGDKVMVCLSGGKDSLSLLHILLQYQNYCTSKGLLFSLGAVTVDPINSGCDPCLLMSHLRKLGVHYIIDDKKSDLDDISESMEEAKESVCTFSSSSVRHRLYASARSSGYNVLAIGQHLDDLCESFLLSVFHTGKLQTMKSHYYIKEHDLRIIRPFVYVREKAIRQFSNDHNLPVMMSPSTLEITKEKQRIRQLLAQQEIMYPKLFNCFRSALHPLLIRSVQEENKKKKEEDSDSVDYETEEEPVSN